MLSDSYFKRLPINLLRLIALFNCDLFYPSKDNEIALTYPKFKNAEEINISY